MEALAFIHSAVAYEGSEDIPQLRSFEELAQGISAPLFIHLVGVAIASTVLLSSKAALAQVYQVGSSGPAVEDIQQALGISADGVYGPQTEAAIRNFQSRRRLEVDGVAGPETLRSLGLGYLTGDTANTGGPAEPVSSVATGGDRRSESGTLAAVKTPSGTGVYVRDRPNGQVIGGLDENERVTLTGRQSSAAGLDWAEIRNGGWVASKYLVSASTGQPLPGDGSGSSSSLYVVAIPGDSYTLLSRVRRYVPGAYRDTSGRGKFINAGAFSRRSNAERLSDELRQYGLDARVAYRP